MSSTSRAARFHLGDKPPDQRTEFQRDRDRILYSSAFRRLSGITQVISPIEQTLVHNRLTHTLEVAQIARRLAEKLQADPFLHGPITALGIDPEVAEAAALAHDLGHPPFGHIAENELDELAIGTGFLDGFNGNAQSFRIVTRLSVRNESFPGLNLTRATLDAILKYPWLRPPGGPNRNKWGAYISEHEEFTFARGAHPSGNMDRCIEAEIMDWADDIAYAVHDMEDFYRAGLIPLDALITNSRERDQFLQGAHERLSRDGSPAYSEAELERAFQDIIIPIPARAPFRGGRDQRASLRYFTSVLIGRFLHAFSVDISTLSAFVVHIDPQAKLFVTLLKQLTWHYVIESASLATIQFGQRQIIRRLFEIFMDDAHSTSSRAKGTFLIFPEYYREQLRRSPSDEERHRLVIDLVASLTEPQATGLYQRLTGISPATALQWT